MHGHLPPVGADGGHAAHKAASAVPVWNIGQDMKQFPHVALVTAFAGKELPILAIACGPHAWRAAQRRHFQTGIVRNADKPSGLRHGAGLDEGVFLKRGPVLRYFAQFGEIGQAQHLHAEGAQRFGKFADLARIGGAQHDALRLRGHACLQGLQSGRRSA